MVRASAEPLGRAGDARHTGRSLARVAGRPLCWNGVGDSGIEIPAKGSGHEALLAAQDKSAFADWGRC